MDPILNSPYECPAKHWELDDEGQPTQKTLETCRPAKFITPIRKPKKRKKSAKQEGFIFDKNNAAARLWISGLEAVNRKLCRNVAGELDPLKLPTLDSDWEGEFCRVAETGPKVSAHLKNHNPGREVPYHFGSTMRYRWPRRNRYAQEDCYLHTSFSCSIHVRHDMYRKYQFSMRVKGNRSS